MIFVSVHETAWVVGILQTYLALPVSYFDDNYQIKINEF